MRRPFVAAIAAVLAVLALPALAAGPTCVVGVPGVAPSATVTFVPPTLNTDGSAVASPLTYNVYASLSSGAETKVVSGLKGSPIVLNNTSIQGASIAPNTTVYLQISVTDANGHESALSNEACKSFPASLPNSVTITIS